MVRVSGKDRDTLQEVIALLRQRILESTCSSRITGPIKRNEFEHVGQPSTGKKSSTCCVTTSSPLKREFGRDTVSNVAAITEIGEYLRGGGGKRIRPALLLLSSKLFGTGAARSGSARSSRSSTRRRWFTTTSSTRLRPAAGVRPQIRSGETPSACSPATGSTCRRSKSRCRSAISAFSIR